MYFEILLAFERVRVFRKNLFYMRLGWVYLTTYSQAQYTTVIWRTFSSFWLIDLLRSKCAWRRPSQRLCLVPKPHSIIIGQSQTVKKVSETSETAISAPGHDTVVSYQNESFSSRWELPCLPPSSLELWRRERASRQLSFWWKILILIGHYGMLLCRHTPLHLRWMANLSQ